MVVAPDTGPVADVVFIVEGTANMGAYLSELKANYIVPTLEFFSGGPAEDKDCGSDLNSTMYALIVFMAADSPPEPLVQCYSSPTTSVSKFMSWLDHVPFVGGAAEGSSHIAEGLGTALQAFDDFQTLREPHLTTQKHCVLICNSPPYPIPCFETSNYIGHTADQLASLMGERGINLSIISPRKIPSLFKLYDKAGGDLHLAQNKNYTKDRRHLVLLKGYQLQERPLSPASVELKDKGLSSSQLGMTLGSDTKPLLGPNCMTSVGSPVSNAVLSHMQSQGKGKKRPAGGSPPTGPPFKQPTTMLTNHMSGLNGQTQQQQQPQMGPGPGGPHNVMGQQQQQPPMNISQPNMPNTLAQLHMVGPQMTNQQVRPGMSGLGPPNATISRPGQISVSQTAPSFMNQPNPPNVTITKGPPLPVITSQPMDSLPMNRPNRDQSPVNVTTLGPRMTWNPPGDRVVGPGGGQGGPSSGPQQMSQLVMRLQQPARGSGLMSGPRSAAPDLVGPNVNRPPNAAAAAAAAAAASQAANQNPGNMMGMMQQPGGLGGPNMNPNFPQGPPKGGLTGQINMGPHSMQNNPSVLQNQLGPQPGNQMQQQQQQQQQQHMGPTSMPNNVQQVGPGGGGGPNTVQANISANNQSQPNTMSTMGNMGGPGPNPQQNQ